MLVQARIQLVALGGFTDGGGVERKARLPGEQLLLHQLNLKLPEEPRREYRLNRSSAHPSPAGTL